jgi:hypothetical protein
MKEYKRFCNYGATEILSSHFTFSENDIEHFCKLFSLYETRIRYRIIILTGQDES